MNAPRVRWAVLGVVFVAAFVALGLTVRAAPLALDAAIARGLDGVWREPLGTAAGIVSDVLGPVLPVVFGIGLLLAAALRRQHAGVLLRLVLVLLVCRLTSLLKPVFDRQRPRAYPELSYPSGHVVSAASTGLVAILLCAWLAPRAVRWVAAAAVAATVLCAAARIVLGVHWLSDTAGAALAVTGAGLLAASGVGLLPSRAARLPAGETSA
ncbi:phosphatase PAP2 family protein [Amycolatopsis minnesotensis]|uniref:Phosphatase PAP2 family protein n=1 Tax=Amycolatopsis minnesotensis TaxID=337894 RepID=A0ABP5E7F5_9PSEU